MDYVEDLELEDESEKEEGNLLPGENEDDDVDLSSDLETNVNIMLGDFKTDLDEEVDQKLQDYEDKFDAELAKAPEVTVEWLNQNTGILDGNVLAINSIKSKHLQSGSITAEKIEAGAIKGEHITADNAFIDKINSKLIISDLIMAGKIEGNQSEWDLNIGKFTNYNDDKSSVVNIHSGMMELSGKQTERSVTLIQDGFEINRFKDIEHDLSLTRYTMSTNFGTISEHLYAGTVQSPMKEGIISYEYSPTDNYIGQALIGIGDNTLVSAGDLGVRFGRITVTKDYLQRIEDRISALERGL